MRYFAWAGDHDVWDPRWLELLVAELEKHPEASVAYPLDVGITADGEQFRGPWRFDTAGVTGVRRRFVSATVGMRSGCVIYGLHRVDLLERCGVFHPAIIPDRILNEQLAMIGEFRQVDEVLWPRRYFSRKEVDQDAADARSVPRAPTALHEASVSPRPRRLPHLVRPGARVDPSQRWVARARCRSSSGTRPGCAG